jgi:prepilin-type processing-associated H-X9-DG protein
MMSELRSYSLNSYIGTPSSGASAPIRTNAAYRIYTTSAGIAADAPARRFAFMDVNPGNICTPGFGVDMVEDVWIHYPSFLHGGRGMVSFADTHVEAHKWLDPRTRVTITPPMTGHGDPAANNQDFYWIRDRTTSKK